jgi:hypothetical protein
MESVREDIVLACTIIPRLLVQLEYPYSRRKRILV